MLKIKIDTAAVIAQLKTIQQDLHSGPVRQQFNQQAADYFRAITPIKSGYARRNTRLSGDAIHAAYPYADKLDAGASAQAPQGMTAPTIKYMQKLAQDLIQKYIKRQGSK